jgi:hypothetical protein
MRLKMHTTPRLKPYLDFIRSTSSAPLRAQAASARQADNIFAPVDCVQCAVASCWNWICSLPALQQRVAN